MLGEEQTWFSAKNYMKVPKQLPWGSYRGQNKAGWGFGHYLATWVLFVTSPARIVLKVEQAQKSRDDF